ncbi:hypothetical protein [Salana multivorans]
MSRSSTPRRSHRPTAVRQLDVEPIDGGLPFHRVVAALQERVAGGATSVVVSGSNAAAVASRLVRLLGGGVDVVVRLAPVTNDDDAARAARDAVALAGIAGGRASVEVETGLELALLLDAVREALRSPGAVATHFGGDLFTSRLRLPWPVEVDVRVAPRPLRLAA